LADVLVDLDEAAAVDPDVAGADGAAAFAGGGGALPHSKPL